MQLEASQAVAEPMRGAPEAQTFAVSPSLVTLSRPNDEAAEAIRALRTHVMAQHVVLGRRALSVCAASPGVGCTYVAANLAVAMSQIGIKTLLIDGNLREPGLDSLIRPSSPSPGLQQYLSSDDDFGSGFRAEIDVLPNLSLMFAGGASRNPHELLAMGRFEVLMNACLRDFELTIVDTPPANSCSDARRVSSVLGYSMVVARRNHSRVEDLKTLVGQLQGDGVKVIGTVLNEF